MPIYEYRCRNCGHELEALQFLNEDPLTECPECGKAELKRKISAAGFRLSGKGWYETDFKSKEKQRNLAGERDSGTKKSEESSGKKSSKSDAKGSGSEKSSGSKSASGD